MPPATEKWPTPQSLIRRLLFPAALVAGLMFASALLYDQARGIENAAVHRGLAHASAAVMFVSIWFGAFIAHPIAFFRGAAFFERILAAVATPILWSATVLCRAAGIYSTGEFFFLFLHHLVLGAPLVALLCFGISEIICRAVLRRRTGATAIRVFTWPGAAILPLSLALVVVMLWKGGHTYYYWYMELYAKLFQ